MFQVSAAFGEAVRAGGTRTGYVEVWRSGARQSFTGPDGNPTTQLPLRSDGTNQVTVDATSQGPRRTLTVTLAPLAGMWDLLSPIGTELHAFTVLTYTHGASETIPQGVFLVDVQRIGYASSGDLQITAPDRWQQIINAEFLTPRASTVGASVRVQIASLISDVFPSLTVVDTSTSTATTPTQTWDRDRAKAIRDLAKAASLDVGFDRTGNPYIRNTPQLAPGAVWLVDAGASGVLMDATRERNRQNTYNIIKVSAPASSAGVDLFAPVFVWDNNSASPTYAGSGSGSGTTPPAANTAGPFGQRCYFYSSPLVTSATQATAAGQTLLGQLTGLAAQLTLTAAPHPGLDDGDTIQVVLPQERYDIPRPVERHIVDKFTVPLAPQGSQSIETRSTVADINQAGP